MEPDPLSLRPSRGRFVDNGGDEGTVYLGVDDVLDLYAGILGCTHEAAGDRLRSTEGLEGTLARPLHYAHYTQADMAM